MVNAINDQDYDTASSLRDEEAKAKTTLDELRDEWKKSQSEAPAEVNEEDHRSSGGGGALRTGARPGRP